ncbi:hypothetical protein [Shewanella sediminis]|uniref:hypothetical protein n=1 Tax=Shewanella sediminis TaxID=271097 RepID=UPI0002FDA3C3|nr:hypothetical protein [Shewanella sediminis]
MNIWLRVSVLVVLLGAAVVCYAASFSGGAIIFMLLGVLFELAFWVGLFKTTTHKS